MPTAQPSRAERRSATEARILGSARELFAEKGFDRTTVRAVAAAAGVDPALVMQYFGSKRGLFTQAVQALPAVPAATGSGVLADQLLATLGPKLGGLPEGALAMMRSMLTDPGAAEQIRALLSQQADSVVAAMPPAEDAELRALLALTTLLGVTVGHQLLGLPALRDAPTERIAALLRPGISALTQPQH
ncbi:TetR family transcriptional regulator [Streptomyces sp. NPDC049040]|uniref:TetR family transcriptional regulator n=1 Tax=Streptomyces sp. NPDC049040 TaxID=3365593 RepID=UPI003711C6F0